MKTCTKWRIQVKMHESSKLGYTSTSNGYKWAIKYKHTKIKCGSLVVQVYTQVFMKATSKHVIKTMKCKRINKTNIIIMYMHMS